MGFEHQTPAPLRPDLSPIRRSLAHLLFVSPDHYALASMGICRVCNGVRAWAPTQLAEGKGWHARFDFLGVALDFVYGFAWGVERLTFVKLSCSHPSAHSEACSHLGFVELDSIARPRLSSPRKQRAFLRFMWSRSISDAEESGRIGTAILANLLLVRLSEWAVDHGAGPASSSRASFTVSPWLPCLYLPAHVPRADRSDLNEHRPDAGPPELDWEFEMTNNLINVSGAVLATDREAQTDTQGIDQKKLFRRASPQYCQAGEASPRRSIAAARLAMIAGFNAKRADCACGNPARVAHLAATTVVSAASGAATRHLN
jgi:hypothetical protein